MVAPFERDEGRIEYSYYTNDTQNNDSGPSSWIIGKNMVLSKGHSLRGIPADTPNLKALLPQIKFLEALPRLRRKLLKLHTRNYDATVSALMKGQPLTKMETAYIAEVMRATNEVPPLEEEIIVYRGQKRRPEAQTLKAPISTSIHKFVALNYARSGGGATAHIIVPAGSRVLPLIGKKLSYYNYEAEILLPPGSTLVLATKAEKVGCAICQKEKGYHLVYQNPPVLQAPVYDERLANVIMNAGRWMKYPTKRRKTRQST
jgi:hypothetical protein